MKAVRFALPVLLLAVLAGCATAPPPGAGWSRASDLSVYEAMIDYAALAQERDVLCAGFPRDRIAARWAARYGARQDWIEAALAGRYGTQAVAEAAADPPPAVECGTPFVNQWQTAYARLLRLMETRLWPEGYLG